LEVVVAARGVDELLEVTAVLVVITIATILSCQLFDESGMLYESRCELWKCVFMK
jgi:hypothetical protein